MDMQNDFDRLVLLEHARKTSEAAYAANPLDVDNLIRWGGSLLELSQFHTVSECKKMIQDSISKLEEALSLDSKRHDALWTLGNALTSQGFMIPDQYEAETYFYKASGYFQQAVAEDPGNELYERSLEMCSKASLLHKEIHQPAAASVSGAEASTSSRAKTTTEKKNENSDLMYDIGGWIILLVGVVAWVGFAKSQMPLPPPTR